MAHQLINISRLDWLLIDLSMMLPPLVAPYLTVEECCGCHTFQNGGVWQSPLKARN